VSRAGDGVILAVRELAIDFFGSPFFLMMTMMTIFSSFNKRAADDGDDDADKPGV
jgi:hypothetical protein